MVLIPRGPKAVLKDENQLDENLVLRDALRAPQDEVLFMRRG
jgi:hypothetical protein